jgi:hypothetical protein
MFDGTSNSENQRESLYLLKQSEGIYQEDEWIY